STLACSDRGELSYPADVVVRNDHSGRSFEQTSIESDQIAADALARELRRDELAAGGAKLVPKLGIERKALDGVCQRFGIIERYQQGIDAGTRDIAASGHVGRNQRPAAGRSFEKAQWHALAMRRQDRDMGARPECADVFHITEMADVGPAAPGFDLVGRYGGRVCGIRHSRDQQPDVSAARAEAL